MLLVVPAASAAHHPLRTGLYLGTSGADTPLAYTRAAQAGTSMVRISARWADIAPDVRPVTFNPRDPQEPSYDWHSIDSQVELAAANHLEPLLTVYAAPGWAQHGNVHDSAGGSGVDPEAFAGFATAIATRYDGSHGFPRVRYWEVWNEPNVNLYLSPQFAFGSPASPAAYRDLLNRFAAAVHAVHPGNLVVAGGLSPFTVISGSTVTIGPLRFMRALLCMSAGPKPHPTCSTPVTFDVWSHHPYTSGDPTHTATNPDDVSLGDLPEMRAVLDAAYRAGHIVSRSRPGFWVTEYSWDTKPPDPGAVPLALHARWVSESLYRMWLAGVDVAIWLQLVDEPYPSSPLQAGLYFRGSAGPSTDRPKPALTAFSFPFVAYGRANGVYVWGRTPRGERRTVAIDRKVSGAWRRVAVIASDRYGVFAATLPLAYRPSDSLRATLGTQHSLAFSLRVPPDMRVDPFGA